jgi:hypothetical protein
VQLGRGQIEAMEFVRSPFEQLGPGSMANRFRHFVSNVEQQPPIGFGTIIKQLTKDDLSMDHDHER